MSVMKKIKVGNVTIGADCFVLIAGPCAIEDEATSYTIIETLISVTGKLGIPFIFKASFDKANRTSIDSPRGPGLDEGLEFFRKVRQRFDVPLLTDVHSIEQCAPVAEVVDCLQIPAFLCRQTDLLIEAGRTGCAINIKKGQFMAPASMTEAVKKVASTGNDNIILTERGTTFGYNNLVVDYRSLPIMRAGGYPLVFDATHSVQLPSANGKSSGGDREMVKYLARAAVAVGVDGLFMETHPDPAKALSDGPNSIALADMAGLLGGLKDLDTFVRGRFEV
jgi:2-dehydro-3-deoxyphosphooctonate aldolase (KDO 8-P synthase)